MSTSTQKNIIFILAFFDWLALDLLTKRWAVLSNIQEYTPIIGKWLGLLSHQNDGIAFGIFLGHWNQILFSSIVLIVLIYWGLTTFSKEKNSQLNLILLGIVSGGAVGNLVNRIYLGYVVDFIYLWPLPIFNIADIGISIGLVIIALREIKRGPAKINQNKK